MSARVESVTVVRKDAAASLVVIVRTSSEKHRLSALNVMLRPASITGRYTGSAFANILLPMDECFRVRVWWGGRGQQGHPSAATCCVGRLEQGHGAMHGVLCRRRCSRPTAR